MLLRVMLVAEILSAIICLHCIYGEKFRLNVKTVTLTLSVLIVLEVVNCFELSGVFSALGYVFLIIYCKFEFKNSILETVISFVLSMIILTITQFGFMFMTNAIFEESEEIRNLLSNIMTLVTFTTVLPKCKLHKLQKGVCENKNTLMVVMLGFMGMVVLSILLQGKVIYGVHMQYFVLVVPAMVFILHLIVIWYKAQTEVEQKEEEICKLGSNMKIYDEFLTGIRLRQHEFKNHMTAIFSSHLIYNTYDNLVRAQKEYCSQLQNENKYNNLLMLGNNVLVGYLYGKFQEIEADGIKINYKINASIEEVDVPIYYIVEMLGILLDNAVEAVKYTAEKTVSFEVGEMNERYMFTVMNPFPYVQYDELIGWFKLGKSQKGSERGVGLYHLKCLCEQWKCSIECKNIEIEQKNWITFTINARKTDGC